MKLIAALILPVSLSLAACAAPMPGTPMVGGPCSYAFMTTIATVSRVLDEDIELVDAEGLTFYKPLDEFDPVPEVGARFEVAKRYITQGSCTPYGFEITRPAPEETSESGE
ncbi:hypothetical protein K1X12_15745 [Hyphomonas sp. WL0036]|uniref:hypothetical protein n=1 Tax=Hyphomonas sediminis TaxID=2866160 RepID=UPI001C7FB62F|nr:hypothetical protein [Hyphomonas sediminis]MBY9068354.1 hypothetical protein [Hyphomonas sediminis]